MERFVWSGAMLLLTAACGAEISDNGLPPSADETTESSKQADAAGGKGSQPWMPPETPTAGRTAGMMSAAKTGTGGKSSAAGGGGTGGMGGMAAAGSGGQSAPGGQGGSGKTPGPDMSSAMGAAGSDPGKSSSADEPGAVRWLGRVDDSDPKHVSFSWAGSGFAAVVKGPTVSVTLESQGDAVYYVPVIDGEPGERIMVAEGEHVVKLADGLGDGEHDIELYRDTEGDGPVSIFSGFEEGTLVGTPKDPGRFFEVVGDSISVGFGSRGVAKHGDNPGPDCGADHSTSSWFLTYEAVAARALKAEVSTVARSGYGMYRGYGMNTNVMPPLFDHTQGDEDTPLWKFERKPAALIINLGTNDWNGGDPGSAFETAYLKFLDQVRQEYPDTEILLTIGSTLEDGRQRQVIARLEKVIAARQSDGDDKIDMFDIGIQDANVTGCGWHPSETEHARMGKVLADELRKRLNW